MDTPASRSPAAAAPDLSAQHEPTEVEEGVPLEAEHRRRIFAALDTLDGDSMGYLRDLSAAQLAELVETFFRERAAMHLPLNSDEFPDEALALVCSFLDLKGLGRLACTARRFTQPALTEPGRHAGSAQLLAGDAKLSPIEEGVRLQLVALTTRARATGEDKLVRLDEETWMQALWRATVAKKCKHCNMVLPLPGEEARECPNLRYGNPWAKFPGVYDLGPEGFYDPESVLRAPCPYADRAPVLPPEFFFAHVDPQTPFCRT